MKKVISYLFIPLFIVLIFSSCSNSSSSNDETEKVQISGKVVVENGAGKKDTVSFTCIGCSELLKSTKEFDMLIKEASTQTKTSLNFPLSFVPKDINLTLIKVDTLISVKTKEKLKNVVKVIVEYKYIAKNAYGNELEGDDFQFFYLQDSKIADLEDEIQLESLAYVDGSINRTLELLDHRKTESMRLFPGTDGAVLLVSSLGCVDEGTWLLLGLENGEEIKLISWNDFNCDGKSFFKGFTPAQKEKLKANRLKTITIVDDKSMICSVPLNQADYWQQVLSL
jgi:hypothetical protein